MIVFTWRNDLRRSTNLIPCMHMCWGCVKLFRTIMWGISLPSLMMFSARCGNSLWSTRPWCLACQRVESHDGEGNQCENAISMVQEWLWLCNYVVKIYWPPIKIPRVMPVRDITPHIGVVERMIQMTMLRAKSMNWEWSRGGQKRPAKVVKKVAYFLNHRPLIAPGAEM